MRYRNQLLDTLARVFHQSTFPTFESVTIMQGTVIEMSRSSSTSIYFPESAIFSLQVKGPGALPTEIAVIGNSGAVGLLSLFGSDAVEANHSNIQHTRWPHQRIEVLQSGTAWRASGPVLLKQAMAEIRFFKALMLCNESTSNMIAITALCNTSHSALQRICRKLLVLFDESCLDQHSLPVRSIEVMDGAPSPEIKCCIDHLIKVNAIEIVDSSIYPRKLQFLAHESCTCYDAIKRNRAQLFSSLLSI